MSAEEFVIIKTRKVMLEIFDESRSREWLARSAAKLTSDHKPDFNPTPRLRSLRTTAETEKGSLETATPFSRHLSIPDAERSPLRLKLGSAEGASKPASTRTDSGWLSLLKLCTLMAAAVFIAVFIFVQFSPAASGPTEDAVGIQQIVQWAPGDYVQEILPHSTNNDSSQTDTSGREEEFAASLLQAFEAEGKLTIAETELSSSEDGVAELFNALSEKDITASTRGDDVTEEQHHSVRSEAESEDVEETSEVGFGTTTGGSGVEVTKEAKQQLQAEKAALHDASTEIATSIGQQHLRVFVAGLGPQYNLDILQALLEIDNPTDSERFQLEDIVKDPLQVFQDSGLLGIPSHYLDIVFHSLLLQSPLRVTNMSDADIVWVPFWVHKLVRLDQEIEKPNKYDLAQTNFWQEVDRSLPLLGKKPHILVVPGQEAELRGSCGGFGISFLCHPRAYQLTILSPEIHADRVDSSKKKSEDAAHQGISVSVPEVSNIRLEVPDSTFDASTANATKAKLISEAFRARGPIRKALKTQCLGNPRECSHAEPSSRLSSIAFTKAVYQNDKTAWFSLQPPGDTTVRMPFFNSLLAGAIPVVLNPGLLQFLPFSDSVPWQELLVQVDPEKITAQKLLIVDILKAEHTVEDCLSRLERIHGMRHIMHYQTQPAASLVHFDDLESKSQHDDAFTMSLKALMRALCNKDQFAPGRCPDQKTVSLI